MRGLRAIIFSVVAVIVLGLLAIAIVDSASFQNCVCGEQKHDSGKALVEEKPRLPVSIQDWIRCTGTFLDSNNGSITAIASLLIAIFTGTLWYATIGMLQASDQQGAAMERSIAESARAATTMEQVAKHFADNVETFRTRSAQQMRAYLSVLVSGAIYQERERNFKFEGKPAMLNTGHTPARKVGYKARADILPVPLPSDFAFPLPDKIINGAASLGPQQHFLMSAVVDRFCDDADVGAIKRADGRALYVWGVVIYEDAFGNKQTTKFCQILTWLPDNKIWGYFTDSHNDAT